MQPDQWSNAFCALEMSARQMFCSSNIHLLRTHFAYNMYNAMCIINSMHSILDGNIDMGAHVWSDLGYLFCSRHLLISRKRSRIGFFIQKDPFSFIRAQHVLSYNVI